MVVERGIGYYIAILRTGRRACLKRLQGTGHVIQREGGAYSGAVYEHSRLKLSLYLSLRRPITTHPIIVP